MSNMVYVLGSGPAGLLAAHAATSKGYDVEILTDQMSPSVINGAQYLDQPLLGITDAEPDGVVKFYKRGSAEGYAQKIYGDSKAPTSWDKYDHEAEYPLWYLRDAYSKLWEMFKDKILYLRADPNVMAAFMDTEAAMIVIAMPLITLCSREDHNFTSQDVTVYSGIPQDLGSKYEHLKRRDSGNWIMYNGKKKTNWYRTSCINQGASVEVPGHYPDGHQIFKPLSSNCDCWSGIPRVVQVGRYGTWDKNELVSGAWHRIGDAHHALQ